MKRTNIYLEERQTRALNRLATAAGVSRAEMLRRILDRGLAGEADTLVTNLAAVDAAFGCLADVDPELPLRSQDSREEYLRQTWGEQ